MYNASKADFQCKRCLRDMKQKRSEGAEFTVCLHADTDENVAMMKQVDGRCILDKKRSTSGVNAVKCFNDANEHPLPKIWYCSGPTGQMCWAPSNCDTQNISEGATHIKTQKAQYCTNG